MTDTDIIDSIVSLYESVTLFVDQLGFEEFFGLLLAFIVAAKKDESEFMAFKREFLQNGGKFPVVSIPRNDTNMLQATAAIGVGPYRLSDCVETVLSNLIVLSSTSFKETIPLGKETMTTHEKFLQKAKNLRGVLYNVAISKSRPECFSIAKLPETLGFSNESAFVSESEKNIIEDFEIDFICAGEVVGFKEKVTLHGQTNRVILMDRSKYDLYEINPFLDNILVALDEFLELKLQTQNACAGPEFTEKFTRKIFEEALGFVVPNKPIVNNFSDSISFDFRILQFSDRVSGKSFNLKYRNYHSFIEEDSK